MVHRVDEPPRMAISLHVPTPCQRLVRGDDARRLRGARERAQLVDEQCVVADRVRRHVAAHEHAVRAERVHQLELALRALEIAREALGRHALEIAKRLEQHDGEAEIGGDGAHVGGRAVEVEQVVLEDLDAVEAGGANRAELLDERAR